MEVPEKEHLKRAWRKECLPHVVQNVIIGGLLWGLGSTIIVLLVTKKTFLAKYLRTSQKALFISMATVGGVIVSGERATIECRYDRAIQKMKKAQENGDIFL
jgi:hypothetical protein